MNLEIIHVGLLGTNCYVTWDDNKNCVVVDCGGDAQKVADFINERGFTPTHLLLTHGHGDHMGGAADLKDLFPQIQIVLGEKDLEMLGAPGVYAGLVAPAPTCGRSAPRPG